MPIYEYLCENGHHLEIRQSFSDAALSVCPQCGAPTRRVIQPAGIVFKGSGFYVTDSRGKQNLTTSGEKKTSEGGAEVAASTEKSSENGGSKTETTPKAEPAKASEPTTASTAKPSGTSES